MIMRDPQADSRRTVTSAARLLLREGQEAGHQHEPEEARLRLRPVEDDSARRRSGGPPKKGKYYGLAMGRANLCDLGYSKTIKLKPE